MNYLGHKQYFMIYNLTIIILLQFPHKLTHSVTHTLIYMNYKVKSRLFEPDIKSPKCVIVSAFLKYIHGHSHSHFSWKGATRLTLSKAPTRETRPDHNTGNYVRYSFRQVSLANHVHVTPKIQETDLRFIVLIREDLNA